MTDEEKIKQLETELKELKKKQQAEKRKGTTHAIRERMHLSQQEFAITYNIPVGTVRNWDARGTMPGYVEDLLNRLYDCELKNDALERKNERGAKDGRA